MFSFNNQKRFWSKVNVKQLDECWDFIGGLDKDGYGVFYLNGTSIKAHRCSYSLYNILNDCACHTCHNPSCVNPLHLYDGTHKQNMNDMRKCGRSRNSLGSNNVNTNLTENEIIDVMNLVLQSKLLSKESIRKYNSKFKDSIIQNFITGKSWGHIRSKFSRLQIEHIQDTLNGKPTRTLIGIIFQETQRTKLNNIQLGKKYGLTNHTISRIRNKRHKYSKNL